MEVVFLQGAEAEVQAAFELFGGPDNRRAAFFLERLDRALDLLRTNPEMAPRYAGLIRRLLVRGFSHALFYSVLGNRIIVTAVLDLRQDPARLRERLGLSTWKIGDGE